MRNDYLLEETSAKARQVYCHLMREHIRRYRGVDSDYGRRALPVYDGGRRPSDGRRTEPVWPKLARFVLTHRLDLEKLLRLMFRMSQGGQAPPVNVCYSARALELYRQHAEEDAGKRVDEVKIELRSQATLIQQSIALRGAYRALGWTSEDIVRSVLDDPDLGITPLMRYCMAVREGYRDLADKYHGHAQEQYARDPLSYAQGYDQVLPSGFTPVG
jgi:hypothetical protein